MEFNRKLQELRKLKGLTQEELANAIYVSRTAISKWESGRGYPNIDSLKRLAKLFSVTVDDLLSGDELLTIAENDQTQRKNRYFNLIFGLLDICTLMLFFLPFFALRTDGEITAVSLLELTSVPIYLKIIYYILLSTILIFGVVTLSLQNCNHKVWLKAKNIISLLLNTISAFIFVISLQPYPAIFLLIFLIIKVLILIKTK